MDSASPVLYIRIPPGVGPWLCIMPEVNFRESVF
jgi:hypothetical protein